MINVEDKKDAGSVFLSTVDTYVSGSSFLLEASYFEHDSYLTKEDAIEYVHPCTFLAKVKYHNLDNPTYKDKPGGDDSERRLWDKVMIKEMKALA